MLVTKFDVTIFHSQFCHLRGLLRFYIKMVHVPEAAEVMKLTANHYLEMGIIERIMEPIGGAHQFPQYVFDQLKSH